MDRAEIHFDQVFSVVRKQARMGGRYTNFGFEFNGRRTYDIEVPGWPTIEPGMTVVALFGKENDWSSFLGWVDSNGHSTVRTNPYLFLSMFLATTFFMLVLLTGGFALFVNIVICIVFGGPALLFLWIFIKELQLHKEVLSILDEIRRNQLINK